MASNTRVVIPCRISYANIWEPKSVKDSEPKYSVVCLIPKTDTKTIANIEAAINAAKEIGRTKKWGGEIPAGRNFKTPLHDGDEDKPNDEVYKGCMYVNAIAKDKPQIVDRKVQPILDQLECASGDYCNVSVNFYAFNANVNKGIAAGLGNIQKVKTGERLSGRLSASADFASLSDDSIDDMPPDFLS